MKIGLKVVGLNVGGPGDDLEVPAFAKQFGIQYTLAKPDEDLASFLLAGSDAIPQTFIFDRQGQLVQHVVGFGPESVRLLIALSKAHCKLKLLNGHRSNFEKSKNSNHSWSSFTRPEIIRATDRSRR